jgi:putative transposase
MRFAWIKGNLDHWPAEMMCRVLGVSRSGYYAWRDRPPCARLVRRQELLAEIRRVYKDNRQRYGSPRICRDLRADGIVCNVKTVARIMQSNEIVAKTRRRFRVHTTDSNHPFEVAPNRLGQKFTASAPNEAWVADLTYVPTGEGWLYLSAVLDLYSRRVVGYAMADHLKASLAVDALTQAIASRSASPKDLRGLLHHSDRGVQYACETYQAMLSTYGIQCSMSRKGNCYDNAAMESFFKTLKTELVHHERYATRKEARNSIADYIDTFYNTKRRHSTIGYLSPVEFENMTG